MKHAGAAFDREGRRTLRRIRADRLRRPSY